MKDFYVKYFRAEAGDLYHNKNTGLKTARCSGVYQILTMRPSFLGLASGISLA